jgi:hypothetical protein
VEVIRWIVAGGKPVEAERSLMPMLPDLATISIISNTLWSDFTDVPPYGMQF